MKTQNKTDLKANAEKLMDANKTVSLCYAGKYKVNGKIIGLNDQFITLKPANATIHWQTENDKLKLSIQNVEVLVEFNSRNETFGEYF